jgi:CrcB protein
MTGFALAMSVAGAGAAGAVSRYLIDLAVTRRSARIVPRGTMTVNIVGSFMLGLISGLVVHHHLAAITEVIIGTGFCGGLTTASSAAFETARLMHQGHAQAATITITAGIGLSCLAGALGLGLALI